MDENTISPINPGSPRSLDMRPEDIAELKEREATITRQQRVLEALRRDFLSYVEKQYGVDLANEEWIMDLEAGTLVRG